ncbi:MAG: hypothetical protein IT480_05875 [Gammaproteobacteria bacterium]|nr:hypothetical protein [Gammaproteobacteria bacterium]
MNYAVLSPVGEVDPIPVQGLNPRLATLNGKTIGLFATFKEHWVYILDEIGRQLQARFSDVSLKRFRYRKDLNAYTQVAEVAKDPDARPEFEEWIKGCDAVIVGNADAGSCTLYLSYNATLVERLGKPGVMTLQGVYAPLARSAFEKRGVPAMRTVDIGIHDLSLEPDLQEFYARVLPGRVSDVIDDIIAALTGALTPHEIRPPAPAAADPARIAFSGSLQEVHDHFYIRGWAPGTPIVPPTEETVRRMVAGSGLAPDQLVGVIPPRNGRASVEKIAVNAVMAGCLPTHMPVLIAAVRAITDPRIWIEAYTTSMASWMPMLIINGPIRHDIRVNCDTSYMSPYDRANACIGRALGLIIMNISGVRARIEDMGVVGHEGHFGVCFGENEEQSPWEPLHQHYGLAALDSAVTVFFPNTRLIGYGVSDAGALLASICDTFPQMGFDPGCAVILSPLSAGVLARAGFSRRAVAEYIVEYARRPAAELNVRWMRGNGHDLGLIPLPREPTRSVRKVFSDAHLPIIVAGNARSPGGALYGGGGDHGGPITRKIELPKDWAQQVERYRPLS